MKLIEKYKTLESEEKANVSLFFAYLLFAISAFIPYKCEVSQAKINENSIRIPAYNFFDTTLYGYESGFLLYVFLMTLFINMVGFTGKSIFNKIILIVLFIFYSLPTILIFLTQTAGFGAPHGNTLYIGYYISVVGSMWIAIICFIQVFRKI